MVQSGTLPSLSLIDLARRGDLRAIAYWLNHTLRPYGIRARLGSKSPGRLKLLVEFEFPPEADNPPALWQDQLIRFICHHFWKLNSPVIEGVSIAARFVEAPKSIVWKQSVRIVTPANQRWKQARHLRSRIRQTTRRKTRLRTARTLLVGGPAVAAVVVGGMLGYSRAPIGQTNASAATQPNQNNALPTRPDTVRTALEVVPVVKHNQVVNPQDPTVTLLFSGDVTLAEHFAEIVGNNHDHAFAKLPEYKYADLAMVNLENPLTRSTLTMPGKQFNFKADPEAVKTLTAGGVDIVSLANNHTMDFEAEGLKETLDTLNKAGIQYVGAGKDLTEARRPKIVDVKGQRIAYLSYWGEEYGAEANKPGVNNIREERIAEDIRAIRDQVDWVIVNYHWGQELADFPADWQVKLAHFTVDHGADVVVGHHPHVLQGAEIYKGRAIAYSLGNFIFGGNSRTDYDTAVLKVALSDKQMKVEFLPVEVQKYQPRVVEGARADEILQHLKQISADFQQPMPASVVLDARPPAATATTPGSEAAAPDADKARSPSLPSFSSGDQPASGSQPAANGAENPANTPAGETTTDQKSMPPAPPPADPENILPGYGGEAVPPSAPPAVDSLGIDPYDPFAAPLDPTDHTLTAPKAPDQPATSGPQLPPTFSKPADSFTNAPSNTPLENRRPQNNLDPLPATDGATPAAPTGSPILPSVPAQQPAVNDDADSQMDADWQGKAIPVAPEQGDVAPVAQHRSTISFQIRPKPSPQPTDEAATQDVALAAPMMW